MSRSPAAWVAAVIAGSIAAGVAGSARADGGPSADLRGYRNPVDARAGLYVEPATTPDTGDFSGGFRFNYAFRPVVLHDQNGDRKYSIIEHQLTADLYASVGLWKRLSIGFDLPAVVAQAGDDISHDPAATKIAGTQALPTSALGDPGLVIKGTFVRPPADDRGVAIGLLNRLTFPLGDPTSFLGEGAVTDEVRGLVDIHFLGFFTIHLTAGAKLRTDESSTEDTASFGCGTDIQHCNSRFGHEALWAGGLEMNTAIFHLPHTSLFAELRGYVPIAPVAAFGSRLPSGTFLSVSHRFDVRDVSFFMGSEFALDSGIGNAPYRLTLGMSYTPRNRDRDHDGIDDDVDRCPDRAEDFDGVDDEDGCPEADGVPLPSCATDPKSPTDKPASDKPASDKPVTEKPASDKPVTEKPASDDKPVNETTGEPASK